MAVDCKSKRIREAAGNNGYGMGHMSINTKMAELDVIARICVHFYFEFQVVSALQLIHYDLVVAESKNQSAPHIRGRVRRCAS